MGENNNRILVKYGAAAIDLAALVLMEEPTIFNINANTLETMPPSSYRPPGDECCIVLQVANLACICRFKSYLLILANNSSKDQALLMKCGVTTIPRLFCSSFGNVQLRRTEVETDYSTADFS